MTCLKILLLAAFLAACASSVGYTPAARPGAPGYSETRIEADRYRVAYRAAGRESAAQIQDYALLRAAELTLAQGYEWFQVTHRYDEQREDGGRGGPRVSVGVGGGSWGRSSGVGVGVGVGVPIGGGGGGDSAESALLEIRLGRGPKPEDPNVYAARDVQSAIRARM